MPGRSMNSSSRIENFLLNPEGAAGVSRYDGWGRELRILDHATVVRFHGFLRSGLSNKGRERENDPQQHHSIWF